MAESRNVDMDEEGLEPVDAARGISAEGAVRSRNVKCQRR
jgi:hypothetical protein